MGLFVYDKMDRDFPGGLFLPVLGKIPSCQAIETVSGIETLRLPLAMGPATMEVLVANGQSVKQGALLAQHADGLRLYAPADGKVGPPTTAWVNGQPRQPVLELRLGGPCAMPSTTAKTLSKGVSPQLDLDRLKNSGLMSPEHAKPLAAILEQMAGQRITTVVANACPLEAAINTPLAILDQYPEQVFAGLAILKQFLGAKEAVIAYPYHFSINRRAAEEWEVHCVGVSEKYPQGRPEAILRTLQNQGHVSRRHRRQNRLAVFDIQLLRQVERLILADELPLQRIVTVSGDGVDQPKHFLVPVGIPLSLLLAQVTLSPGAEAILEGGSMTGQAVDPTGAVISPISEGFSVIQSLRQDPPTRCIRCGWCIDDCPARLDPARLYHLAETGQFAASRHYRVQACFECGVCSYVCPARLRIREFIHAMKTKLADTTNQDRTI